MEQFLDVIQNNVIYAPYIIFGLLLLAGLNIPVSEDLMLFISGVLAAENPKLKVPLFLGVFLGAYLSDLICYWLGRKLGPSLWKIKIFANMVSHQKVDQMAAFYRKYGIFTLLVGRFIPFGVRNALFLTAGLSKMNFAKFGLTDFIACVISCLTFFSIYYAYGEVATKFVAQGNQIIFALATIAVIFFIVKKKKHQKKISDVGHDYKNESLK